jgi:hypothetical protein
MVNIKAGGSRLTSGAGTAIFGQMTGFLMEPTPEEMKTASKNGKSRVNGRLYTRKELLAAHERALKRLDRMTPEEGFATLVEAGIYTPDGKLAPRYGG